MMPPPHPLPIPSATDNHHNYNNALFAPGNGFWLCIPASAVSFSPYMNYSHLRTWGSEYQRLQLAKCFTRAPQSSAHRGELSLY